MKTFKEVFTGPYQVNRLFITMIFIFGMFVGCVVTAIVMIRGLI